MDAGADRSALVEAIKYLTQHPIARFHLFEMLSQQDSHVRQLFNTWCMLTLNSFTLQGNTPFMHAVQNRCYKIAASLLTAVLALHRDAGIDVSLFQKFCGISFLLIDFELFFLFFCRASFKPVFASRTVCLVYRRCMSPSTTSALIRFTETERSHKFVQ